MTLYFARMIIIRVAQEICGEIQKKISDEMSSITGGLQLPPGFKMPF